MGIQDILDRLEPHANELDYSVCYQASIAISLKRIADAMTPATQDEINVALWEKYQSQDPPTINPFAIADALRRAGYQIRKG